MIPILPHVIYQMFQRFFPIFLITSAMQAAPVFIGTSTGKSTVSKGIYLADFNSETGQLSEPTLAAEYQNPGFLALHPTQPILYACGQPKTPFPDGSSAVAGFRISADHSLRFLGEAKVGGKGACHLTVDASGKCLAVANYGDGSLATIALDSRGVPGAIVSSVIHSGSGPVTARQAAPHAHGVYFDAANRHLLVPDLGIDQVLIYPFDPATSKLGSPLPSLPTAPGAGPRHLAFSPDGSHIYTLNELDNTILAASYRNGKATPLGTVPTLPADFTATSTSAEIVVHPSGKYVYSSNRGHDSITAYTRDTKAGTLTVIQTIPCGGKTPRNFTLDPSGKWLLCAHQASHTISVLALDPLSGKLSAPHSTVSTPSPICLIFPK
jgi:6-phosphogluconolactonase